MSQFIAASGSCFDPDYRIDGHLTHNVKNKEQKVFVSAEFVSEIYTDKFWNELAKFAKDNNKYISLYVD